MKLVANWKSAHKWLSTWAMGLPAAYEGTVAALPEHMRDAIPHEAEHVALAVMMIAGILGRLVDQTPPAPNP